MTRLEIISDLVCPWCYLGAANLMRAVTARAGHPFRSAGGRYQLDPTLPAEGIDRAAYMAAKFGATGRRLARRTRGSRRWGPRAASAIRFDRITRAPNTLDAPPADPLGGGRGAADPHRGMALFRRYFELGEDISDPAVLRDAAAEAGLDGAVMAQLLAGDADRDAVRAEAEAAREMGVTGVPTFILGGRYVLTGAQPLEVWEDVIDQLEAAAPAAPT